MKRLIFIFISCYFAIVLSSCQLAIKTTENKLNDNTYKQIIGFRVLHDTKVPLYNEPIIDYYYFDEREISPYLNPIIYEEYTDDDGAFVKHTTVDVHVSIGNKSCHRLETIFEKKDGTVFYEGDLIWYCNSLGAKMSTTIFYNVKNDKINETIKYTVNFIYINNLIEYSVIEYDANHNKLKETYAVLTEDNDFLIDKNTEYFIVTKKFKDDNDEIKTEKALYSASDNELESLSQTMYFTNENQNRSFYHYKYSKNK